MASTTTRAVERARREAIRQGARTIEAEHLLLALAVEPDCKAVLDQAGWDDAALRRALRDEWEASLVAVGVTQEIPEPGTVDQAANPKLGESFKQALVRGVTAGKERRRRKVRGVDLLFGVVTARQGTVPRALTESGAKDLQDRLWLAVETP